MNTAVYLRTLGTVLAVLLGMLFAPVIAVSALVVR